MSNDDKEFVKGFIVKKPHENWADFVKCGVSIKSEELIKWLHEKNQEWVNLQIKVSKGGKWYAEVDNWKPESQNQSNGGNNQSAAASQSKTNDFDDDIPF